MSRGIHYHRDTSGCGDSQHISVNEEQGLNLMCTFFFVFYSYFNNRCGFSADRKDEGVV